jgi:hypothetical protein
MQSYHNVGKIQQHKGVNGLTRFCPLFHETALRRETEDSDYVFTTERATPFTDLILAQKARKFLLRSGARSEPDVVAGQSAYW